LIHDQIIVHCVNDKLVIVIANKLMELNMFDYRSSLY